MFDKGKLEGMPAQWWQYHNQGTTFLELLLSVVNGK
jgi:hypothetical protein